MIQTYFDRLKRVIDSYAAVPFVLDVQVSFELRQGDQGLVVGQVISSQAPTLEAVLAEIAVQEGWV